MGFVTAMFECRYFGDAVALLLFLRLGFMGWG